MTPPIMVVLVEACQSLSEWSVMYKDNLENCLDFFFFIGRKMCLMGEGGGGEGRGTLTHFFRASKNKGKLSNYGVGLPCDYMTDTLSWKAKKKVQAGMLHGWSHRTYCLFAIFWSLFGGSSQISIFFPRGCFSTPSTPGSRGLSASDLICEGCMARHHGICIQM